MFIAKELIAKGLLATAATATAITLAVVYGDNIAKYMSSEDEEKLIGEVGLSCDATTNICSLKSGATGLNVKLSDNSKEVNKTLSGTGKIKKLIAQETEGYNKNLKFVIVGGDITLTAPTAGVEGAESTSITKLEEFETYEIKEEQGKYYFSRKTDVNTEIKKALGLPDGCNLPTTVGEAGDGCDISGDKFKNINFEGKDGQTAGPEGAKLKISKVENANEDYGNYKLKFVLASTEDATIANGTTIKANTNTEFKIKVTGAAGQGPRAVTLEKAWTVAKLAKKIGVTENSCALETADPKECTLPTTISVFNGENSYVERATIQENQKITFATGVEGYSQGYKFTVTAGAAIQLTAPSGGTVSKAGEVNNIEANGNGYEIKEQTVGGAKKWFLSKKTSAS